MSQSTSVKYVLLCEDECITVLALRKILVRNGYVVIAEASEGAVAVARQLRPDLILMDIGLQGTASGLEATRAIMKECPVPIILMSGYAEETMRNDALASGAVGYLIKPVTAENLMEAIQAALQLKVISTFSILHTNGCINVLYESVSNLVSPANADTLPKVQCGPKFWYAASKAGRRTSAVIGFTT